MTENKEVKEKELEQVTGGLRGPNPNDYIYKVELAYAGVACKESANDDSETICIINQFTIIYVTELNSGNGYVKCMFAGNKHREYGYIKEIYVPRP